MPTARALETLNRLVRPTNIDIASADQVDHDALYLLDHELRNDVPGSAVWYGTRAGFDDEMQSPEYDPTGYYVAVDQGGALVGLCRFWHNSDGPSLGMLGVVRSHRRARLP